MVLPRINARSDEVWQYQSESRDGVEHKSYRSFLGDQVCLVAQSWDKIQFLAALLLSYGLGVFLFYPKLRDLISKMCEPRD